MRFAHAADFFKAKAQARVDNSTDRSFRSFLSPDLLILNRHRSSTFVISSNRAVDELLSLFDDPILGNNALLSNQGGGD